MRGVSLGVIGLVFCVPLYAQHAEVPARLSLADALRIAETRNPQIVVLQERVAASDADVLGARKRPNPVLSLSSEGMPLSQKNRPAFFDNQELILSVEQELEPGGRRGLRTSVADRAAEAARAVSRDSLRQLRFEVSTAYMAVVLAKANEEAARTTLQQIDTVLALNRVPVRAGRAVRRRTPAPPGRTLPVCRR